MSCLALRRVTAAPVQTGVTAAAAPAGFGPADLQSAYKLPSATAGAGQTVAIVDAFDDPNAEADLGVYRQQFGIAACTTANGCFRKVNQSGQASPLPASDAGWASEISLDLDMVSAVCPKCHILLVEATTNNDSDLFTAVDEAITLGARFVSNSYGGGEISGQTSFDTQFFQRPGIAITASSGDNGFGVEYPAASRFVTAVGGTSLARASNSRGWTESAWSGAGSGCSQFDAQPTWQQNVGTTCPRRAVADVSAVADPSTGVAVYDTFQSSGFVVFGGTSVASPVIASVYALAGAPGANDTPASYPYAHTPSLFDATSGSNGSCGSVLCTAGLGWDGPTGLGTPNGTAAFTAAGTGTGVSVANPGAQTTVAGHSVSLQLQASGGTGSYTWSASGLPAGLSIGASTGVISGSPTTAGSSSVTVTATDTANAGGQATFSWTVTSAGGCTPAQLVQNGGFENGTAPWSTTPAVISANGDGETAHTGTHYAWLDGYFSAHTDTAAQTVTIPSGCASYSLTYWLKIDTQDTTTATDTLTLQAGSQTVSSFSNTDGTGAYVQETVDLSPFAGQTVQLLWTGTEDGMQVTSFVVDDVALNVS